MEGKINREQRFHDYRVQAFTNLCNRLLRDIGSGIIPNDLRLYLRNLCDVYFPEAQILAKSDSYLPNAIPDRMIKDDYRNSENHSFFLFLIGFILSNPTYFSHPINIIKGESPDFIVEDKNKRIGIECTQLISRFHRECCMPFQSAIIEASIKKEPLPKKQKFGITGPIVKLRPFFIDNERRGYIFGVKNIYDNNIVIKDMKKLITKKEQKISFYKNNAQTDNIFLLVQVNGFSRKSLGMFREHIEKIVFQTQTRPAFKNIIWQSFSDEDMIEIYAPYEELP